MRHIANFFEWLFEYRTNALMPALFMGGATLLVITVTTAAFILSPIFGIGFILLVFFGVPILSYATNKSREDE